MKDFNLLYQHLGHIHKSSQGTDGGCDLTALDKNEHEDGFYVEKAVTDASNGLGIPVEEVYQKLQSGEQLKWISPPANE